MINWFKAFNPVLLALIPVILTVGAGFYSAVRQCNQDASGVETQLTSTLLEISDREARMKSLLAANSMLPASLSTELAGIEKGVDGHFGDPLFKDHSLISLVNQYNRLLRRLQFPACPRDQKCIATVLNIDTRVTHPAIETLDISKSEPHAFAHDIDSDLAQIDLQQDWHKSYGPVRLCEPWTLAFGSEPWHLIRLDERANSTTK